MKFDGAAPRLSDELVALCHRVHCAPNHALKAQAEDDLREVSGSAEAFEGVVRAFKWRIVFATWLYFDDPSSPAHRTPAFRFQGGEARTGAVRRGLGVARRPSRRAANEGLGL
jgi:hypothetical protein